MAEELYQVGFVSGYSSKLQVSGLDRSGPQCVEEGHSFAGAWEQESKRCNSACSRGIETFLIRHQGCWAGEVVIHV